MDVYQSILVGCFTLMLISTQICMAIECYECTNAEYGCGEGSSNVKSGCALCEKITASILGFKSVKRSCLPKGSPDDACNTYTIGIASGKTCTCSSERCNGQTQTIPNHAILASLCFFGILLWRLL